MGLWADIWLLLVGYAVGGLTFVPILLWAVWAWGTTEKSGESNDNSVETNDLNNFNKEDKESFMFGTDPTDALAEKLKGRTHTPDVASGYFAVCREYVPGGINGKPPERTTPAGAIISMESPSVYQSMYRSIFDRNKTTTPSIDPGHGKSKKARNIFYVVLR